MYKRILVKLSGEAFAGSQKFGVEPTTLQMIAKQMKELQSLNISVGIVIGGGNIFRGSQAQTLGLKRTSADHVGMLSTLINGIILQEATGGKLLSALDCEGIEKYSHQKALEYLENREIVIFVGGTSHPYFTTDTAAALRACEMEADLLLKLTQVDGIYDKDPKRYSDAVKYTKMTYAQILSGGLQVMDLAAVALCQANGIPIRVCNLTDREAILRAVHKEEVGTLVTEGKL